MDSYSYVITRIYIHVHCSRILLYKSLVIIGEYYFFSGKFSFYQEQMIPHGFVQCDLWAYTIDGRSLSNSKIKRCSRQRCTYFTFRNIFCNTRNQYRHAEFPLRQQYLSSQFPITIVTVKTTTFLITFIQHQG